MLRFKETPREDLLKRKEIQKELKALLDSTGLKPGELTEMFKGKITGTDISYIRNDHIHRISLKKFKSIRKILKETLS